ncbi:TRAP transporter large permease [Chloroflexota bacterium]
MVILGIAVLLALVVLGMPIWGAIFGGTLIMVVLGFDVDAINIVATMYDKVTSVGLIAVPLFIFSGLLLAYGGSAAPLVNVLNKFMAHIPGGPAYVVIIACAIFGAMSSSSAAATAGFAPIMIPMMLEMGYSRRFAIGLLMASTALAPLIPPSIPLILFGFITQTSIRDLYTAGFIPGLMLAFLLAITVFIHTSRGHYTPPPKATWGERWQAVKEGFPVMLMPVIILVPMYIGIFTPSEAGAVAAVYSLLLGFLVYRKLNARTLWEAASRTVHLMAMIFAIVMSAFLLSFTFTYVNIPFKLNDLLTQAGFSAPAFLIIIMMAYLLMGMFLDPGAILLISPPILMPTVLNLGIDPIVFGVLVVFNVEIAGLTPPYGLHLFVASGILKEKFAFIVRSCVMFYPALVVGALLIAYVPQISLFLPNLIH